MIQALAGTLQLYKVTPKANPQTSSDTATLEHYASSGAHWATLHQWQCSLQFQLEKACLVP